MNKIDRNALAHSLVAGGSSKSSSSASSQSIVNINVKSTPSSSGNGK